ncbi:MAG: hypothetical protein NUV48_14260 [Peptococcaceae bacterium]|jgi:hypothetical protein|nr:hypothetical protein [Peptococcaceae bacterium]
MKKKRTVFLSSLLALGFSWGASSCFNRSDRESVLLLESCLLFICLVILFPVALRSLKTDRPYRGGLFLLLMMLPLVVAISHPSLSLVDFTLLIPSRSQVALITGMPWLANAAANGLFFFLAGHFFVRATKGQVVSWKGVAISTFILAGFYTISLYCLYARPAGFLLL